ncbi:cell envelope biogenesis protein OmpA [Maribacter litopenaei]|uniref:Cell envelope biogenesis protein OmpA n=1 Tax=Maribacter litopenaei TaxID=2976127 RepID=A0ABY5Y7D2_9FLAO|nr:cell envelope biogenesis protein OmpA [Maribacter litopenaei]UWX53881.1 cell envelope biogenesis protein OmpA [Maribacter litopenaei]
MKSVSDGHLDPSYQKRYDFAISKLGQETKKAEEDENWTELVKSDYHMTDASMKTSKRLSRRKNFKPLYIDSDYSTASVGNDRPFIVKEQEVREPKQLNYESPVVLTKDGKTAYFSKEVWVKPTTGIFSKKQKIHRIFRADKVNGEWKSIKELALCPKDYSALHPAISKDGTRLFFASNMPGTFGEYDIYVSNIRSGGIAGVAKNLGTKVNTSKNEMYPKVMEGNTLVFASEGHQGYGGLDVYMVEVEKRNVGLAMNMGSSINSSSDDFSIQFTNDQMGYVMSNRGGNGKTMELVAFSFSQEGFTKQARDFQLMEAMNTESRTQYSSSVFEDEN